MKPIKLCLLIVAAAWMTGCASKNQALYSWGNYQGQVYDYFKGQPVEKQIIELEKIAAQAKAKGTALPPGYQAHLGLLYAKTGRDDKLAEQLSIEKTNFPESAQFIDGLLKKFAK